jgi:hypothetical protein
MQPFFPAPAALLGREVANPVQIAYIRHWVEVTENIFVDEPRKPFRRAVDRFRSLRLSKRQRDKVGPGVVREIRDGRIDVLLALGLAPPLFLGEFYRAFLLLTAVAFPTDAASIRRRAGLSAARC